MQPVTKQNELPMYSGKLTTHTLPSGRIITIREINGNDESVLSSMSSAMEGDNFHKFISNLIVDENKVHTVEELLEWPISDVWALIYKARVINHGPTLEFKNQCQNPMCKHITEYEEDLRIFDKTLFELNGEKIPENYVEPESCLKPYPAKGNLVEFTINSQTFRFKLMNGAIQKASIANQATDTNKNTKLIQRQLEVNKNGEWEKVLTFHPYSVRETAIMRSKVDEFDIMFNPTIEVTCGNCKQPAVVEVMPLPSFFWPGEI